MNTAGTMRETIRMAMLLLGGALIAQAETTGNVTWTGGGGAGNPGWNVAANWTPEDPAVNTPGQVTLGNAGQAVNSLVEVDRSVNTLYAGHYNETVGCTHTINLGGTILTITNRLRSVSGYRAMRNTLNVTNGTVRVGSASASAHIDVHSAGTLRLLPGTSFDPVNIGIVDMNANAYAGSVLDLQGVTIVGGELAMQRLLMPGNSWYGTQVLLNGATTIDALTVTERLWLARANVNNNTPQYIGNPSRTFTFDGVATFGRFPAGVDLNVGVSETQRASLWIAEHTEEVHSFAHTHSRGVIRVAPGGGGSFTAYLSELKIGMRSGSGVRRPRGMLHLSEMDSCLLDALVLEIAPGRTDAQSTDDEQGELWLPSGTATIGTATIGAPDGVGWGRLSLSNTVVTVTNALTLNKTADIRIRVGATASGLALTHPDPDTLTLDPSAKITVTFLEAPTGPGLHYGLRLPGDQSGLLDGMLGTEKLSIESPGLARPAIVFVLQGKTYVGVPPPPGALLFLP